MAASIKPNPIMRTLESKIIGRALLGINAEVAAFGVSLEFHTDFDLFREVVSEIPDKGSITALFDPRQSNINSNNGFWIKGVDQYGEIVHVQAMRVDDLGNQTIARGRSQSSKPNHGGCQL